MEENMIFNSLWIGKELSALELLTMQSFIRYDYHFRLWVYEPLDTVLPAQVEVCNAREILSDSYIFSYCNENKYGHGKGSVAGFSDIFRYKLLYEKGGWWVDMDVTCLRKFNFPDTYYFRRHDHWPAVGSIMRCPARSELMLSCYKESVKTIDKNNTDWDQPIRILNKFIIKLHLEKYIHEGHSNQDRWEETSAYIFTSREVPAKWYFIHWQNEEWRYRNLSKLSFYQKSFLAKTLSQYGILLISPTTNSKVDSIATLLKYILRNPYVFLLTIIRRRPHSS